MARHKLQKTNAMRELDRAGIGYAVHEYEVDESDLSGVHVAAQLGQDPRQVFKTLVTVAPDGSHIACCIPVARELDLKAAARTAHQKSLSMLHVRDLLPTTGYVRGGCSPIGMKKRMRTLVDSSCLDLDSLMVSGGRRGLQLELSPSDLIDYTDALLGQICMEA